MDTYSDRDDQHDQHDDDNDYIEGIRLFNEGHFWHAHEAWERCWLGSCDPDYTFYKGIIQAAGALYHWQKGNPRGLHLNWAKSRPKLLGAPPHHRRLNLPTFVAAMDAFVAAHDAGTDPPFPRLIVHDSGAGASEQSQNESQKDQQNQKDTQNL